MARTRRFAGVTAALLLLAGCSSGPGRVRVGSKNFTEQVLLGEIIAQHLEKRLGPVVERRFNLGGTLLAHQAMVSGDIDLYPEYTGTGLMSVLKLPPDPDPARTLQTVRSAYRERFGIEWFDPLGFNNTFAMIVQGPLARKLGITTLSSAGSFPGGWRLGAGYEFQDRPDGLPALTRAYQLPLRGPLRTMDLGLLYQSLDQGQVDMIAGNSTDGLLSARDLAVLDDDRHAFPPYQAAITARRQVLAAFPGLRPALAELSGKLNEAAMRRLNYEVDGKQRPVAEVAAGFLAGH